MLKGILQTCPKCGANILFMDKAEPGDMLCMFCGIRVYGKLEKKPLFVPLNPIPYENNYMP